MFYLFVWVNVGLIILGLKFCLLKVVFVKVWILCVIILFLNFILLSDLLVVFVLVGIFGLWLDGKMNVLWLMIGLIILRIINVYVVIGIMCLWFIFICFLDLYIKCKVY